MSFVNSYGTHKYIRILANEQKTLTTDKDRPVRRADCFVFCDPAYLRNENRMYRIKITEQIAAIKTERNIAENTN